MKFQRKLYFRSGLRFSLGSSSRLRKLSTYKPKGKLVVVLVGSLITFSLRRRGVGSHQEIKRRSCTEYAKKCTKNVIQEFLSGTRKLFLFPYRFLCFLFFMCHIQLYFTFRSCISVSSCFLITLYISFKPSLQR